MKPNAEPVSGVDQKTKNKKANSEVVWKQFEDLMIPRLELCLAVRAVLGDSRHLAGSSRGRQTRTHSEVACRQP